MSRCVECGECKSDPDDFYDGLRCKVCAEKETCDACGGEIHDENAEEVGGVLVCMDCISLYDEYEEHREAT